MFHVGHANAENAAVLIEHWTATLTRLHAPIGHNSALITLDNTPLEYGGIEVVLEVEVHIVWKAGIVNRLPQCSAITC